MNNEMPEWLEKTKERIKKELESSFLKTANRCGISWDEPQSLILDDTANYCFYKCYELMVEKLDDQRELIRIVMEENKQLKESMKPRPISEYDKENGEDVLLYCSDGYYSLEVVGSWYGGKWETPSDDEINTPPLYFVPIQDWPETGEGS